MAPDEITSQNVWDERNSTTFLDYGRYFVPEREHQFRIIADLIPRFPGPGHILELCCGEGLLAEQLLSQHPTLSVYGLDGSALMLQRAAERLARFGERFYSGAFDLFSDSWRHANAPFRAVVTSLALHHLDGLQKQELFRDIYPLLMPGGAFIIADIMAPSNEQGWNLAAAEWDQAVKERALELDRTLDGFHFFEREHWNLYRYFDPEDIDKPSRLFDQLKWLEQAGFENLDVYWMRAGHAIFGGGKPAP